MGCQLLLHEAIGFVVLGAIRMNFPRCYYAPANEECTGKSITFVLELFYTGK